MNFIQRLMVGLGALCASLILASAQAQTQPIKVGGTLALTGPLSATAVMQKIAGEIYVEQLNKRGGWLGRPVEYVLKDDQSKPDVARTLYEQLITVDKVDLITGPYATGAILSAMGVAQRYNKILLHNTLACLPWPSTTCNFQFRAAPMKLNPFGPTWSLMQWPLAPKHLSRWPC